METQGGYQSWTTDPYTSVSDNPRYAPDPRYPVIENPIPTDPRFPATQQPTNPSLTPPITVTTPISQRTQQGNVTPGTPGPPQSNPPGPSPPLTPVATSTPSWQRWLPWVGGLALLLLLIWFLRNSTPTTPSVGSTQRTTPGYAAQQSSRTPTRNAVHGGASGPSSVPHVPPHAPTVRTVETVYGKLTGDVTADTSTIFPAGTVVAIFSPFNEKYLNIVNKADAVVSPDVLDLADAVCECTGTDPYKDPKSQWIVRPPNSHERSVRLDNIGFEELYLREFIAPDGRVLYQPGLGVEWGDMWSSTVNFIAPSDSNFNKNTTDVFIIGAEVANRKLGGKEGSISLGPTTPYLLGTTKEGSLIDAGKVKIGPESCWRIKIIGNLDSTGKPQIKVPQE